MDLPWGEVVEAIDEKRLVRTLMELVDRRSENPFDGEAGPGQGEEQVAEYLAERAAALGLPSERQHMGPCRCNLLITKRGTDEQQPTLLLAGHMDTVRTEGYPDAYPAALRDGRVHGRGAADMKAALACYLEVLEVLSELGVTLTGTLGVLAVADEEYRMEGAKHVGASGLSADGMVIGEPTEMRLCTASKGRVSTFVVTSGQAAHSSVPEAGVNSIVHMAEVVRALERHGRELREAGPEHALLGRPRLNVGVISGGVQVNMVPPECRLEIDRRTLPGETRDSVYAEVGEVLKALRADLPDLSWELTEPSWLVPSYELDSGHPLPRAVAGALAEAGADSSPCGFLAGSDAAHFRIPAVICGPGSIEQAHTQHEWVSVEQLRLATQVYLRAAVRMLGRH